MTTHSRASVPSFVLDSCGAGVQSTTMALLAREGVIPKPDAYVFSDTGWEPREVYDHLDRLEREVFEPMGVPLVRLRYSNLRDDVLGIGRMTGVPGHAITQQGSGWGCTCGLPLAESRRAAREPMQAHKADLNSAAQPKTCEIDGCSGVHVGHGFCQRHYYRWLRHGDPLGGRTTLGDPHRFIELVAQMADNGECVDWPFGHHPTGYGQVHRNGRLRKATHLVLEATGRPQPPAPGDLALHSCDRPSCVAPWHLRWGSHLDNMQDAVARGRLNRRRTADLIDQQKDAS